MQVSIIVSTYNSPNSLRLCLLGFLVQTAKDFEILIADDGSDDSTLEVLDDPAFELLRIRHVWHEDRGFRKSRILNRAIASSSADYVIFCDGDCIPRNDFVASHLKHARAGCFISGTRVDLAEEIHRRFVDSDVLENRIFDINFLTELSEDLTRHKYRLVRNKYLARFLDLLTYRYCVFHGSNASVWRKDLIRVNGFDHDFVGYGSEDRDLGVRLRNAGVRSKFLKFSLVQIHLAHGRDHIDSEAWPRNRRRFKARFFNGDTHVANGLDTALQAD